MNSLSILSMGVPCNKVVLSNPTSTSYGSSSRSPHSQIPRPDVSRGTLELITDLVWRKDNFTTGESRYSISVLNSSSISTDPNEETDCIPYLQSGAPDRPRPSSVYDSVFVLPRPDGTKPPPKRVSICVWVNISSGVLGIGVLRCQDVSLVGSRCNGYPIFTLPEGIPNTFRVVSDWDEDEVKVEVWT